MPPELCIEGGCHCGQLRYAASVEPSHSMICHCRSCRECAAAPWVPWVTFPRHSVHFRGARKLYASSAGVERSFCPHCGTSISYTHAQRPEEIDILSCTLDQPEAFPPKNDSWLEDELPWMQAEACAARPGFARFRPEA